MFVSLVVTVRASARSFCFVRCSGEAGRWCLLPFSSLTLSWRDLSSQIGHTDQTVFSVGRSSTSYVIPHPFPPSVMYGPSSFSD